MPAFTLDDLISQQLGVRTQPRVNPEVSSVGVADVAVLRNNPNRVAFIFVNLGANDVFLVPALAGLASSTNGIRCAANGGGAAANWRDDFNIVGVEWHAIAPNGASAVLVISLETY